MKSLTFPAIWIAVVLCFTGYGFFKAYGEARYLRFPSPFAFTLEPSIGSGAIGVGVGTCGAIGLAIVSGARSGWLRKPSAGFLLVASLAISTVLPFIIISQIQFATRARGSSEGIHLFQGEHSWWLFLAPMFTLMIG